jgi:RNA polymerase sigma-70 factor (ECF subfamily)
MAQNPLLSPERERQLVRAVQAGDRGPLGELLCAYQKRVFHVCLRMVSDREDAAELTQEALLRAVQHIENYKRTSSFSTWLIRIAMNLSISHLRKRRVRSAASLDGTVEGEDQATALKSAIASEREPEPGQSVQQQEHVQLLEAALEALDPALRSVIVLRDLQEMDYKHIAEVLAVPVGTVKSRLFRGRLALRREMEGSASGEGSRTEVSDG